MELYLCSFHVTLPMVTMLVFIIVGGMLLTTKVGVTKICYAVKNLSQWALQMGG